MIHIDPKCENPIYRQIMEQIKLQIMTGQLQSGQQLESVSSMSGRMVVNPMTISKAYGFLVREELLERRAGVGIFVAPTDVETIEKERHQALSRALESAAELAIQLEVPKITALGLFEKHLTNLEKKVKRKE